MEVEFHHGSGVSSCTVLFAPVLADIVGGGLCRLGWLGPPCAATPLDMVSVKSKAMKPDFMIHAPWVLRIDARLSRQEPPAMFEN
jgi:hypothetical protein